MIQLSLSFVNFVLIFFSRVCGVVERDYFGGGWHGRARLIIRLFLYFLSSVHRT